MQININIYQSVYEKNRTFTFSIPFGPLKITFTKIQSNLYFDSALVVEKIHFEIETHLSNIHY